jgi:acetolactate synthase-like protein
MLVGCNAVGIRVVDVRDEVTTCFAADATARLTGIPGVAMVTAGPGLTNTITAVKNAQLAESPIVVFGGATAMLLKGRGALQDIDQLALMRPHCKWMVSIKTVRDIIPAIRKAFRVAQEGVPGPVFIETPIEILWPESMFDEMILGVGDKKKEPTPFNFTAAAVRAKLQELYLKRYGANIFRDGLKDVPPLFSVAVAPPLPNPSSITAVRDVLSRAVRPVIVIGSQAVRARTTTLLPPSLPLPRPTACSLSALRLRC